MIKHIGTVTWLTVPALRFIAGSGNKRGFHELVRYSFPLF